jgi:hypothetical protein
MLAPLRCMNCGCGRTTMRWHAVHNQVEAAAVESGMVGIGFAWQ